MARNAGHAPARGRREAQLHQSARWFDEGARLKVEARRSKVCVECRAPLANRRTPYCGRKCQWRFRGRFFWDAARTFVLHRDRFTCQHCRRRCYVRELEVDHIIELAAGGAALDYANLQTVCKPCHRAKTVGFLRGRPRSSLETPTSPASPDATWTMAWFPA